MNLIWLFAFAFFTGVIALLLNFLVGIFGFQTAVLIGIAAVFVLLVDTRR